MDRHRLAEERSIAMHGVVAAKLRQDAALVERARERVREWRASLSVHEDYLRAWENMLALPLDTLCDKLTDPGEHARALRQVSPFAGVLDPRERWAIDKSETGAARAHHRRCRDHRRRR